MRPLVSATAVALVLAACGGDPAPRPTRPPITTTLAPPATTTSPAPVTAAPAPPPLPTTPTVAANPLAIGSARDLQVGFLADGARRFFYAGDDAATSFRENASGVAQLMFYDVYPPTGSVNGTTALYLHGGAFNVGHANDADSVAACRLLTQLGSWCIAVEYRRGFASFSSLPEGPIEVTPDQADRYVETVAMARSDVLDAWRHVDAAAPEIGFPRRYFLVGDGAGATIGAEIALVTGDPPFSVIGLMISSGGPAGQPTITGAPPFPVVIHGGLLDPIAPAYTAHVFYDGDMPRVSGVIDLYDQVAAVGGAVRLYLNAQGGHLGDSPERAADYATAVSLFLAGAPAGARAAVEYRFDCEDANFGAAGPDVRISTVRFPGFRYEPYQTDLEAGLSPATSVELHPIALTNCSK